MSIIPKSALAYISRRQKETIFSIPKAKMDLHCGPFGCGKTYALNIALGFACMSSKPPDTDSCIALIGKTSDSVKTNICNGLASMFGKNFRYDTGKKDGYKKDAVLFGHRIRIIGLNDSQAEGRIRGLNTYKVYGDEVSTWGKDNFNKVYARIRGEKPEGWELGFVGSTNPDSPVHWLKEVIDTNPDLNYIEWNEYDNVTPGAITYYTNLRNMYQHNPAYLQRYVHGKWSASEGLVYPEYSPSKNKIPYEYLKDVSNNGVIEKGIDFKYFTIGVDFGTTNKTAILLGGVTYENELVIIDEEYISEASVTTGRRGLLGVIGRNDEVLKGREVKTIYVDPAAKVFKRELQDYGFTNVEGALNNVEQGILKVKELFVTDRIVISERCENLEKEFYAYAWNPKASEGKNLVKKENDHACDALRYMVYSDNQIKTTKGVAY